MTLTPIASEPDETSALDLRPDGRVVIAFDDARSVTLRRPTLGEFRSFRTRLTEINDDAVVSRTVNRDATEAEKLDQGLDEEERVALRRSRLDSIEAVAEKASEVWWQDVFAALAVDDVPDVDEWPPFLLFGEGVLAAVLSHWRAVPLAPGPRANKKR